MSAVANHWEKNLEEFRRSPSKFLSERNISGDSFVLDILKVLCCENLPENLKLQLLLLIQEKASSLLVESTSVECVVGSLKEMFAHPYGNFQQQHVGEIPSSFLQASVELGSEFQIYLSQVLVTGTVVLITSELLEINQEAFTDFIGVLTDVIAMVNNANNLLLRKAACECLWELELSYPGLLQAKLDHLYAFCATERSPIFQSYMVLFVSVLHHAMEHLLSESADCLDKSCLNHLLTSRTEPLKPLYLPGEASKHMYPVTIHSRAFSSTFSSLLRDVDTREVKRAISFLMDNIGFITTTGLYHVMLQLMQCVKLAGLSPNTFKSQFITWVSTTDLSVFHMLLLLKLNFSRDMFLEHDELLLLQRILLVSSQPTLPQGQRLLCFEWLMYFPTDQETSVLLQPCVPPILQYAQFNFFYPSVFDHLDIMASKLRVLCLCLDHERMNMEDAPGLPLIECLLPLLKRVQHGDHRRKVVVTLFRIIFWYYKNHWDTELGKDIYRLVLSIVTEHPQFTPHAEDLLNSFAVVTPNSTFPTQLLRSLCQHVVSQPMETILPNLANHLKILSLAMRHKDIASSPTIRFLLQALNKSDEARNGNWSTGNYLLAVCHSILLHQHSSTTFSELGDLLLHICATYRDIDIRDRARFYYCLLTNVSSKKCSKILTSETTRYGLPNVTADDITSSSFPVPPPIRHISTPFLKLTRVSQPRLEGSLSDLKLSASSEPQEGTEDIRARGLLDRYMKALEGLTNNKEIPITYYVHFTDGFSSSISLTIYALLLKFHCERKYKKLEDVLISYLSADKSSAPVEGCHQITVTFCPLDPVPATFRVRAIFNNEDGQVCEMMLDNLLIHFSDLFIPLHIPSLPKPTPLLPSVKANLFTALWSHITQNQRSTANPTATGAESIMRLSVEWSIMGRSIEDHLLRFVMMSSDDEVQLGIFLPPRQHLLLKFRPLDDFTVVSIATDDWRLLRLVESYLFHLERVSG